MLPFQELLQLDGSVLIFILNLQVLATELLKIHINEAPLIFHINEFPMLGLLLTGQVFHF